MAQVDRELRCSRHRGDDPGRAGVSAPVVPTPPRSTAIRSIASAVSAAASPASRRASIGVVPAWEAWPAKLIRVRSTPAQPATAAIAQPLALEHRPLLDVELEIGAESVAPRGALADPLELDPVLGERPPRSCCPRASVRPRTEPGSSVPAKAELPNRLRPNRAPSSSAQSTSASGRGGRRAGLGPGPEDAERRHHAERAVEPAAVGDRVEVRAERQRRRLGVGSLEPGPEVARLVDLGLEADLGEQFARDSRAPRARSRSSRRAGRRPRRRCAAASSRRSAITRAASTAGPAEPVKPRRPGRGAAPARGSGRRRRRA